MVRTTRRRIYKRKRSTLSNFKIATRTSAKAQSRQIYALKKRVNRIYRMNKPEVRLQERVATGVTLSSTDPGVVTFPTYSGSSSTGIIPFLGTRTLVEQGNAPVNNFARLRSFNLYGNLEYATLTTTSQPVTLRLVIIQTKNTRAQAFTAADVFSDGANPSFQRVYGPLQYGLARIGKVLSDKRYILSYQRPSVTIRTNLRYLVNFLRTETAETIDKGTIYVFYAVTGSGETNSATLNLSYKLAFIDN